MRSLAGLPHDARPPTHNGTVGIDEPDAATIPHGREDQTAGDEGIDDEEADDTGELPE